MDQIILNTSQDGRIAIFLSAHNRLKCACIMFQRTWKSKNPDMHLKGLNHSIFNKYGSNYIKHQPRWTNRNLIIKNKNKKLMLDKYLNLARRFMHVAAACAL